MLRIIKDTIEAVKASGYNVGLRVGNKWITEFTNDEVLPLFAFDPIEYDLDTANFQQENTLRFVVGYNIDEAEQSDILNIETVEYCEEVLRQFLIKLTNYVDTNDTRPVQITRLANVKQFHGSQFSLSLSGVFVTLYVNIYRTNQC